VVGYIPFYWNKPHHFTHIQRNTKRQLLKSTLSDLEYSVG